MVERPDRIRIWASQLAANDFPPICAWTGRPAETWRRFRFVTPPAWTYALLVLVGVGGLGLIAHGVIVSAVANRASGHLPLTKTSKRTVDLVAWVPLVLLGSWPVLWILALVVGLPATDPNVQTIAWIIFLGGTLAMVVGLIGRFVVTPLVGPRGKVMSQVPGQVDKIVELRNIHPVFVAALRQTHQSRS